MKEKCDNHCETCPMQTQMHCVLVFVKANNHSISGLADRVASIEQSMQREQPMLINPITTDSAILPAQEQEETLNPIKPL